MTAFAAPTPQDDLSTSLGRGVVSGLAGVTAMTAWQKLVEMPITARKDSIDVADKLVLAQATGAAYDRLRDRAAARA